MLLYPLRHQWVAHCNKDYCASTAHNVKCMDYGLHDALVHATSWQSKQAALEGSERQKRDTMRSRYLPILPFREEGLLCSWKPI
jgi:hypothetical protein